MSENNLKRNLKYDIPAGIVVFLVALPLCLGIAQGSGTDAVTGIIAGIIGGIVIGGISKSALGVSGPAAGLITIITDNMHNIRVEKLKNLGYTDIKLLQEHFPSVENFDALTKDAEKMDQLLAANSFNAFNYFLLAIILAGAIQLLLGYLKAGLIAAYFPTSVIKGMLAAIGITLIIGQIPHSIGYDEVFEGDDAFLTPDNHNIISEVFYSLNYIQWGAVIISVISLSILILWQTKFINKHKILSIIPAPLLVVVLGLLANTLFKSVFPSLTLTGNHLVNNMPVGSLNEIFSGLSSPDFAAIPSMSFEDWKYITTIAITIAVVASLETLLSVEATDKLDPQKRVTPTNRELIAQGTGNMISGFIGGLPLTQVIVRSSANVSSGGKTRMSTIIHGILLLLCMVLIPELLNSIPMACLAAILFMVGYKLASLKLIKDMLSLEHRQFIPFFITIVAIFFSNLLYGIIIGLIVAIFYILKDNKGKEPFDVNVSYKKDSEGMNVVFTLYEEVHYLSKNTIKIALHDIPANSDIIIDGTQSKYISQDVLDAIKEYSESKAKDLNISVKLNIKEEIYNEIDSSLLENMKL